ncbi:MAG: GntR family transcriptional regulator [Anaerolineales bacterium]|nr:GntR family transcriptional regulator [Anaerolineales bacterium]
MAKTYESKKDEIYHTIRQSIISGELKPSDVLNEGELAKRFGISKSPVRDALSWLTFEGLLKPLPRFGYIVTSFTVRDIQESFYLRELLEVEAVRLAVERITDEEFKLLEETARMPSYSTQLNRQFHMILAESSGNQRLARLIGQLLDEMERMIALDPVVWSAADTTEHTDLVEAIRQLDIATAEEATRKHIELVRSRVMERFPRE